MWNSTEIKIYNKDDKNLVLRYVIDNDEESTFMETLNKAKQDYANETYKDDSYWGNEVPTVYEFIENALDDAGFTNLGEDYNENNLIEEYI